MGVRPVSPFDVRVRRVYDEPSAADGARVFVDRIWPRGVRKDSIRLDGWAKDAAPSAELRTWYGHDPARFSEFRQRYLVCPECGAVVSEGHGEGCGLAGAATP